MLPETMAAVLRSLRTAKIPFLFFGMEALNMYSTSPAETVVTSDCDFLVSPRLSKPEEIIEVLRLVEWPEAVRIVHRTPLKEVVLYDGRRWFRQKPAQDGTISIYAEGHYHMDIAFGDCGVPFEQMWRRSNRATFHGVEIRVAAKADIIRSKMRAGRDKDKVVLARIAPKEAGSVHRRRRS